MGNNYSLMWIEKSKTDEKFLEYSYQYQKKYPFIWNYLVKKIICNPEISYFRDTTGIIHINLIDYKKAETNLKKYRCLNRKIKNTIGVEYPISVIGAESFARNVLRRMGK